MKPVDQDRFGSPRGNCTEACIASILEIPLSEVPDLAKDTQPWQLLLDAWMLQKWGLHFVGVDADAGWMPDVIHVMSGTSPRGVRHAVVAKGGELIHDPHPDRTGIVGKPDRYYFLIPAAIGDYVKMREEADEAKHRGIERDLAT